MHVSVCVLEGKGGLSKNAVGGETQGEICMIGEFLKSEMLCVAGENPEIFSKNIKIIIPSIIGY